MTKSLPLAIPKSKVGYWTRHYLLTTSITSSCSTYTWWRVTRLQISPKLTWLKNTSKQQRYSKIRKKLLRYSLTTPKDLPRAKDTKSLKWIYLSKWSELFISMLKMNMRISWKRYNLTNTQKYRLQKKLYNNSMKFNENKQWWNVSVN